MKTNRSSSNPQNFQALGYGVCATRGTAEYLKEHGIIVQAVNKVQEGRPQSWTQLKNGEIALVVNTVGSTVLISYRQPQHPPHLTPPNAYCNTPPSPAAKP